MAAMSGPPIPAYPASLPELLAAAARAKTKYSPLVQKLTPGELIGLVDAAQDELVQKLTPGELIGLVDAAQDELQRRGNAIREQRGAPPVRIGNRP
jgi:hypothetical protein